MPTKKGINLKPLQDRVLVKPLKNISKTKSGIILPDSVSEDKGMKRGEVVATGPGRKEGGKIEKMEVKVGDIVLYQWGDEIVFEGIDYVLLREGEISAIIK